jgi:predicted methyltransferase
MISLRSLRILSFAFSLSASVLLLGCKTSRPVSPAPTAEASVHPGINTEYLKSGIVVTQWVERFEREGREIYDRRAQIMQAARVRPGLIVADIGSGSGLFTMLFAEAVGPRGKVYAVDIVPEFLDYIQKRTVQAGIQNVQTVRCTERSVTLPNHSIDLAFLCDVYHHFEYPQSSLASIHQALKPGGELVVVDFKRVPGQSSDWVMNHVRAGQETVEAEIIAAGFKKLEQRDILKDNFILRFRKVRSE